MHQLRKEDQITTADLAQERKGPHPVDKERETNHETAEHTPLFPRDQLQELRSRWEKTQTAFVDEPRRAVQEADALVATTMKNLAEQFANERSQLEKQWDHGDNVSTEDLRQALRKYRAFFDRLISV